MSARWDEIGRIAGRQDNVISFEALLRCGLSASTVTREAAAGRLRREHHGVYLVGPAPPSFRARCRAAVMAVGDRAAVSLRFAAALDGYAPEPTGPVHVTVSGRFARSRPGIVVHRSTLARDEVRHVGDIPRTSPARTICDLAAIEPREAVEDLLTQARVMRLLTDRQLRAAIDRAPHRPGRGVIRAVLQHEGDGGFTESRAERLARRLLQDAGLPMPRFRVTLFGFRLDALWPEHRLVLEVDGRRFHSDPRAFEADRRRDQILLSHGYRVVRVTWRQLRDEPLAVAARIAAALAHCERLAS
jgi:very-short-patch-repair endonuclease